MHESAKQLLDGPQQSLGVSLMAGMAAHEERAYSSIYRWVHAQCRPLEPANAPTGNVQTRRIGTLSLISVVISSLCSVFWDWEGQVFVR